MGATTVWRIALFGRRRSEPDPSSDPGEAPATSPVAAFWRWWADVGHAIDPRQMTDAHDELTLRAGAIHPDLTWHFGPGDQAEHRLTLSAGGRAEGRPAAERWFRAAPPADATWEFAPSIDADLDAFSHSLAMGDASVDLARIVFAVERDADRVHVGVHHPDFAELPDQVQTNISFMAVDWALGEDELERWVGLLEPRVDPPAEPRSVADLRAEVDALRSSVDPEAWTMLEGTDDGHRVRVLFRRGLRWPDHPTFDLHHEIVADYLADAEGLPASTESLDHVALLEREVEEIIEGRGLYLGRSSSAGQWRLHVYTDSEDQNVADLVQQWVETNGLHQQVSLDPAWRAVRTYAG